MPLPLSNCPDILTLSEVTIKKAYLDDIFNVSYLEVTVTSNDILRIEIKRSSTSVLIDFEIGGASTTSQIVPDAISSVCCRFECLG